MPPDTQETIDQPNDETPHDDTPPPADPPPLEAAPQAPPPPAKDKGKKVVMHSPGAISAIKAEERAKAERQLMKRLDDQARALGYRSHDDMMQQAARAKQQPPPQRQQPNASTPPSQQPPNRDTRRVDQRVAQANDQVRKANKARANTDKRNKELERSLRAMEAETELKILAVRCGVHDVDYAISLIKRHTASMSPEDLNKFDEEKYFREDLRKERPYLYGEEVRPADTTPTSAKPTGEKPGNETPAPPPPNPPPNGQPGEVDAKSMTRDQFEKFLASKGLAGSLTLARPS